MHVSDNSALVSIVISAYNYASFLSEAIESCLSQTYSKVEVIVIDDGSTDNTSEIVGRYPSVHYHYQNNSGLSQARNRGAELSASDFLIFLDADDILLPEAVDILVSEMKSNIGAAFVVGRHLNVNKKGALLNWPVKSALYPSRVYQSLLEHNFIACPATVMYDKRIFRSIGSFDGSVTGCEDFDIYLRLSRENRVKVIEKPVALYRHHGSSMSKNARFMLFAVLEVMRRQETHVLSSDQLTASYYKGKRVWLSYYGTMIARQLNVDIIQGKIAEAFKGYTELFKLSPMLPVKCFAKSILKPEKYTI